MITGMCQRCRCVSKALILDMVSHNTRFIVCQALSSCSVGGFSLPGPLPWQLLSCPRLLWTGRRQLYYRSPRVLILHVIQMNVPCVRTWRRFQLPRQEMLLMVPTAKCFTASVSNAIVPHLTKRARPSKVMSSGNQDTPRKTLHVRTLRTGLFLKTSQIWFTSLRSLVTWGILQAMPKICRICIRRRNWRQRSKR